MLLALFVGAALAVAGVLIQGIVRNPLASPDILGVNHAASLASVGALLLIPVSDLPQLSKGKGNKIINIPSAEAARGEDGLAQLYVLPPQSTLTIHVGKRKIKLRPEELQKVTGERGRRGTLMRGLHRLHDWSDS